LVEPFADNRWVIGGPYSHFVGNAGVPKPYVVCRTSMEEFMGVPIGDTFTCYFDELVKSLGGKEVYYNVAIGSGCYWKGCKFCTYAHIREEEYRRPNVSSILENLKTIPNILNRVNLGYAAVPPDVLEEVLQAKKIEKLQVKFFLRADQEILDVLNKFDGAECVGLVPGIGLESPSQTIVDKLNKNIDLGVFLKIVDKTLALGGLVRFNIMDHYPFANKQCVEEARGFMNELIAIHRRHGGKRMVFDNAGSTWWYSKASLLGCSCAIKEVRVSEFRVAYKAILDKKSEAFASNRAISEMLLNSGIPIVGSGGRNFLSLKVGDE
jgi:hypothetical protein